MLIQVSVAIIIIFAFVFILVLVRGNGGNKEIEDMEQAEWLERYRNEQSKSNKYE